MAATQTDLIIDQGATFVHLFEILDKDMTVGYTFAMKVRRSHAGDVVLSVTTFAVAKSGNHTHVTVTVSAVTTAALAAPMSCVYDLESTNTATSAVVREFEGSAFVTPEATR